MKKERIREKKKGKKKKGRRGLSGLERKNNIILIQVARVPS